MEKTTRGLITENGDNPLKLLHALDGLYECPKDTSGRRLGQLVGYAGTYNDSNNNKKQFVGDIYANFAKAEERPSAMWHFAGKLWNKINRSFALRNETIVFVGPEKGGMSIAQFLALRAHNFDARYACAEKRIVQQETADLREQSELIFSRHSFSKGSKAFVVEDVMNNFSTTEKVINLIEENEGEVIAIVGLLNRSPFVENYFEHSGKKIPVIALVRKPYPEYKQDDPAVVDDVKSGNMILKPKNNWNPLMESMEKVL